MTKVQCMITALLCTACGAAPEAAAEDDATEWDQDAAPPADAVRQPVVEQRWSGIQVCQGSSDYATTGYVSIKKQTAESQLEGFMHTKTLAVLTGLRLGTHPDYSCPAAVDVDAMVTGIQGPTDFEADVDRLICTTSAGRRIWLRELSGWEYEGSLHFTASIFSEAVDEERDRQAHQRELDAPMPAEVFNLSCTFELELS